jgi:hypothetical protein
VGFGLLPDRIAISDQSAERLQYGLGLAGGIFIGAGLLHLLPDSDDLLAADVPLHRRIRYGRWRLEPHIDRRTKFGFVSAGFIVMALLAIWA